VAEFLNCFSKVKQISSTSPVRSVCLSRADNSVVCQLKAVSCRHYVHTSLTASCPLDAASSLRRLVKLKTSQNTKILLWDITPVWFMSVAAGLKYPTSSAFRVRGLFVCSVGLPACFGGHRSVGILGLDDFEELGRLFGLVEKHLSHSAQPFLVGTPVVPVRMLLLVVACVGPLRPVSGFRFGLLLAPAGR
jgi:hypothetical protein